MRMVLDHKSFRFVIRSICKQLILSLVAYFITSPDSGSARAETVEWRFAGQSVSDNAEAKCHREGAGWELVNFDSGPEVPLNRAQSDTNVAILVALHKAIKEDIDLKFDDAGFNQDHSIHYLDAAVWIENSALISAQKSYCRNLRARWSRLPLDDPDYYDLLAELIGECGTTNNPEGLGRGLYLHLKEGYDASGKLVSSTRTIRYALNDEAILPVICRRWSP